MFNLEEILQGFVSNVITMVLVASGMGFVIMYFVSKLTGNAKLGGFVAVGVLLLCFYWVSKDGFLIEYLSNVY